MKRKKNIFYSKHQINNSDIKEVTKALKTDYLTGGNYISLFEDKLKKKIVF